MLTVTVTTRFKIIVRNKPTVNLSHVCERCERVYMADDIGDRRGNGV